IKSAIQGSNVPNPDEAVPSFVSGAMAKAGKGLLEGTLQAGTSAVSDKLLDLDRKSGSAGMPRPISYAVFCLKKKKQLILISADFSYAPTKENSNGLAKHRHHSSQ